MCKFNPKDTNTFATASLDRTIKVDDPVASMDGTGKIVIAKNSDIITGTAKGVANDESVDGEKLPISFRDLGSTEIYPSSLQHNCNGRFISVCGDGEFIIYTSQALRNKAFGSALDFCWSSSKTGDYAIRESISRIKIYKDFKESKIVKPATASAEALYGGHLLGVKGSDDAILFYDWEGNFIRKIDVEPTEVYWSDGGEMCLIATAESAYILQHDVAGTAQKVSMGQVDPSEGVDGSFDLLYEISDKVTSGKWVGDCFLYTNALGRLNYSVAGQIQTLVHLETGNSGVTVHSIIGYLAKEDRVYLIDKSNNVTSYKVMLAMLQYQTAIVRGDFDVANELLPLIPEEEYLKVARFLEAQGFKEEALEVTTDNDHKFDLACELGQLELGLGLMKEVDEEEMDSTDTQAKWKKLSDLALKQGNFELAESAAKASSDFSGLLLLYSALGDRSGMEELAASSKEGGKFNVAFLAYFMLNKVEECVALLKATERLPEAAFMARTYLPSKVGEIVGEWKDSLAKVSETAAKALTTPEDSPGMFKDFEEALKVEAMFKQNRGRVIGAEMYKEAKGDLEIDLIDMLKKNGGVGVGGANTTTQAPPPPPTTAEVAEPEIKKESIEPEPNPPQVPKEQEEDKEKKEKEAKAKAEMEAKAKAEKEVKAKAEMEAKAKAEAEVKAKAEAEAKAKAEAEAKAKAEAEAKAKAEAEAKAKAEAEAKAKAEAEAKAKAEAEAKAAAAAAEAAENEALADEFTDDW